MSERKETPPEGGAVSMTQAQFQDAIGSAFAAYLLAQAAYKNSVVRGHISIDDATAQLRHMIDLAKKTSPLIAFAVPRLEDALEQVQKMYLDSVG